MKKIILISMMFISVTIYASDLKVVYKGKTYTTTTKIPAKYIGIYEDQYKRVKDIIVIKKNGSCTLSGEPCQWGVKLKNGKIATTRITPPNPDFKPYDQMIIFYRSKNTGQVTSGKLYTASSKKWGTYQQINYLRKRK